MSVTDCSAAIEKDSMLDHFQELIIRCGLEQEEVEHEIHNFLKWYGNCKRADIEHLASNVESLRSMIDTAQECGDNSHIEIRLIYLRVAECLLTHAKGEQ